MDTKSITQNLETSGLESGSRKEFLKAHEGKNDYPRHARARNSDMWRYLQFPSAVENIDRRRNRPDYAATEPGAAPDQERASRVSEMADRARPKNRKYRGTKMSADPNNDPNNPKKEKRR